MKPNYTDNIPEQGNMAGEPAVAYSANRRVAKPRNKSCVDYSAHPDRHSLKGPNRVYIEDGEVKMDLQSEKMTIEEAKELTLKMVELEYLLP